MAREYHLFIGPLWGFLLWFPIELRVKSFKDRVRLEMPLDSPGLFGRAFKSITYNRDRVRWSEKILSNRVRDGEENSLAMSPRQKIQAKRNILSDLISKLKMHRIGEPPVSENVF